MILDQNNIIGPLPLLGAGVAPDENGSRASLPSLSPIDAQTRQEVRGFLPFGTRQGDRYGKVGPYSQESHGILSLALGPAAEGPRQGHGTASGTPVRTGLPPHIGPPMPLVLGKLPMHEDQRLEWRGAGTLSFALLSYRTTAEFGFQPRRQNAISRQQEVRRLAINRSVTPVCASPAWEYAIIRTTSFCFLSRIRR